MEGVITLRQTIAEDLEFLFEFQLDKTANYLAAFTSKDFADKNAYLNKYSKLLIDPTVNMQTVLVDDKITGSVSKFEMEGEAEITYWYCRESWNKGIATAAMRKFLEIESARPVFGRVAFDNFASQRVLEKCGFIRIGKDKGFANARQDEIEEFIYKLD